ncbi:thioesterase family protein [Paraburkholderia phosphatilytica]|uniref:thioesterase family protein n=1 Tax=Paraburkholderia phosphatilytica TaxID=2282883 RepID=UPI000E4EDC65|nr:thioesterase family protein [Paraburkholderia phosphatilytica]
MHDNAFTFYHDTVRPEWVDYNGHLRDAFYLLVFSLATDGLMDRIGLDEAGRAARQRTIYSLQAHVTYLHEIKEGTRMRVDARVLAHDAKRIHLYMEMFADSRADDDGPVSACEQMLLCVDTTGPSAARFDPDVLVKIEALHAQQATLSPAKYAGRAIALPSRRQG